MRKIKLADLLIVAVGAAFVVGVLVGVVAVTCFRWGVVFGRAARQADDSKSLPEGDEKALPEGRILKLSA